MDASTILNVDDNEVSRYVRTRVLEKAGYRVIEAATGREAISRVAADKPYLVLLDINLPDMNGTEVCRRIKANPSTNVLVVHISATYVDTSDQAYGLESGADGYLCEPVEPELLIATVVSFLRLHEAEAKLRDNEERLKLAQKIAGLDFWEWDIRKNTVTQSGGHSGQPEVTSFQTWLGSVHLEDRKAVEDTLKGACAGQESFQYEVRHVSSASILHWLSTKGRAFYDDEGQPIRLIGSDMDVTERKKIELALQRSNEDLSQFAHMISHDLQEPLRTVATFTELLAKKYSPALGEEGATFMSFIIDGSQRMSIMIRDFLALCQTDHAQLQEIDMEDVFRTVLSNISTSVDESGAIVTHDALPVVWGDGAQLVQVLQNLIANALKYRKPDEAPRIHISGRPKNGEWIISVADNGIGFDHKDAGIIFGVFKRLHGPEFPGTGIGLAIAKKIVERHGGRIWAESQPGQGARFFFTLPRP
jgi:signal transduction histidine kinase